MTDDEELEKLTDADIKRMRECVNAASTDWNVIADSDRCYVGDEYGRQYIAGPTVFDNFCGGDEGSKEAVAQNERNREFVQNVRTWFPWALTELQRLRDDLGDAKSQKEIARLRDENDDLRRKLGGV